MIYVIDPYDIQITLIPDTPENRQLLEAVTNERNLWDAGEIERTDYDEDEPCEALPPGVECDTYGPDLPNHQALENLLRTCEKVSAYTVTNCTAAYVFLPEF